MGVGLRNSRSKQNFKAGGGGLLRKPEDQTDTLLLRSGSRTRAIGKRVLQECPPGFSFFISSYVAFEPTLYIVTDKG